MQEALALVLSTFTLVFAAEWGDKSFLATIALAAASSPVGVVAGAIAGHGIATALAVAGGNVMGKVTHLQRLFEPPRPRATEWVARDVIAAEPEATLWRIWIRGHQGCDPRDRRPCPQYVSEKAVAYIGGSLFLLFAAATTIDIVRELN